MRSTVSCWFSRVNLLAFALFAALIVISRRSDTILHANFWAEDGWRWYPDAYEFGWRALLRPWSGYLQTISRLVAWLVQPWPLDWVPTLFAVVAVAVQVGAAVFLVSDRMEIAWPRRGARVLFALIYLLLPNSFEVYANLTNVQWHLAFFAFLVLASSPPSGWPAHVFDTIVLVLAGLSGPFCLFLAPMAFWRAWRERSPAMFCRAGIGINRMRSAGWVHFRSARPPARYPRGRPAPSSGYLSVADRVWRSARASYHALAAESGDVAKQLDPYRHHSRSFITHCPGSLTRLCAVPMGLLRRHALFRSGPDQPNLPH